MTTGAVYSKFYSSNFILDQPYVEIQSQAEKKSLKSYQVKVKNKVVNLFRGSRVLISCSEAYFKRDILIMCKCLNYLQTVAWYVAWRTRSKVGRKMQRRIMCEKSIVRWLEEMVRKHYFAQEDEARKSEEETWYLQRKARMNKSMVTRTEFWVGRFALNWWNGAFCSLFTGERQKQFLERGRKHTFGQRNTQLI